MSSAGLFLAGAGVSLLTFAALALLVYAAILDGRYDREHSADLIVIPNESREPEIGHAA